MKLNSNLKEGAQKPLHECGFCAAARAPNVETKNIK
jgi:hypothetical protein